jgi:glycerophosphoryl diester phosphodiesterase
MVKERPTPTLGILEILTAAAGDGRRFLPAFVPYEIFFKVLAALIFVPLASLVAHAAIRYSGDVSLSNDEMLGFLASPPGLLALVLLAAVALATTFTEVGAVSVIVLRLRTGRKPSLLSVLWLLLRRLPGILAICALQCLVFLAFAVPALIGIGLLYDRFLAAYDIYYLIKVRPPVFWGTLAAGAVVALAALLPIAFFYLRWIFSVPWYILRAGPPIAAMRESRRMLRGSTVQVGFLSLSWTVAAFLAGLIADVVLNLVSELALSLAGGNLSGVVAIVGLFAALELLVLLLLGFVTAVGHGLLVGHCLLRLRRPEVTSLLARTEKEVPRAPPASYRWALPAAAALLLVLAAVVMVSLIREADLRDRVTITAHRGSSGMAPENSLSALRQAIEDGADYAEIDVQETADGVIVLLHDTDLLRVAGLNRKIWEVTYEEIRDLDAGSWFSPEFAGERIPTLAEAIETVRGRLRLYIELKFNQREERLVERVVDILEAEDFLDQCVVASLKYEGPQRARELAPELRIGYMVYRAAGKIDRLEVDFLSLGSDLVTNALVVGTQREGKELHVWTLNDPAAMSRALDRGVDNIITDYPARLRDLLEERRELTDLERILLRYRERPWR